MIGYLTLPTWERKRTRALLADLLDAQRALGGCDLPGIRNAVGRSSAAIERARTEVWKIRTTVEASIDRTRTSRIVTHTIGAGRALRILAATQRFALANLALESGSGRRFRRSAPVPCAGFADALDDRMAELAAALRESRRATTEGRLAAALSEAETALTTQQCPNALSSSSAARVRRRGHADGAPRRVPGSVDR